MTGKHPKKHSLESPTTSPPVDQPDSSRPKKGSLQNKSPRHSIAESKAGDFKQIKRGLSLDVEIQPHELPEQVQETGKKFGPCHLEAKQAQTAIVLLQSEEQHIVIEALHSLQKFCKKQQANKDLFVELNGIETAMKLIFSTHQVIQRLSMKLLALNAGIHKARLYFRNNNVVKDMLQLVTSSDEVVIEYATVVLANTATLYVGRLQIIQNEGVPLLLELAKHSDPDIQKNTIETVWHLMEEYLNVDLFCTKESMEIFLPIIESEFPVIQIIALSIVEKISKHDINLLFIEPFDIVANLAIKLDMQFADLHRAILQILNNIADEQQYCNKLTGIIGNLDELLKSSKDIHVLTSIVYLFGKLAQMKTIAKGLVDIGICQEIITILSDHADVSIREASSFTCGQLAVSDYRAKTMLISAIKPLFTFFEDKELTLHACEYILVALSIILEEGVGACQEFIEEGGIFHIIMQILQRKDKYSEDTIISTLGCVNLISLYPELRGNLVKGDVVGGILLIMDSTNPQLLALAALSLSNLLSEEDGRTKFLFHNGHLKLVEITSHPELNVAVSIAPLIHAIGGYPSMAINLIDVGIFSELWKRQDLISRNGPYKTALERLISSHLPAKYSMTGHIDAYEKLHDGFYDSGTLTKDDAFTPLHLMTFENRDVNQRIIYLNLENHVSEKLIENNKALQVAMVQKESVQAYIEEVKKLIEANEAKLSEKSLVGIIATLIGQKLGGQIDKWKLSAQAEDVGLANIQTKHSSVSIPITMITSGAHRPRALLFKAIVDYFGIPCSLDRGGFKKCWNIVYLRASAEKECVCACEELEENKDNPVFLDKRHPFVIDLLYVPGSLFPLHSYEANTYCYN